VEGPTDGVVVKQALAELSAGKHWKADTMRSFTEARALEALRAITPARVPRLLDVDRHSSTIVIEQAPRDARSWRELLLEAPADPAVGAALGATVAAWHKATWLPWPGAAEFDRGARSFEQLRLEPFHGLVATRFPDLAARVLDCAHALRNTRQCLVHGDVSPKNVLVGPGFLWLIDPEVAHIGEPAFDIAFMGAHLALNAIARPSFAASIGATWRAFLQQYLQDSPTGLAESRLEQHIGCLLLARTDGMSREPGLDVEATDRARRLGRRFVERSGDAIDAIWDQVDDAIS
jgi:5-methylthioribose kinase